MISVFPSDEKLFADNGLKILKPLKAKVYKEDNGDYYLDLKDTIDNLEFYQAGMIIRVPTPWGKQCFRLTNPTIENKKIISKGYHLYFDTKNYIIKDSYVVNKNCNDALDHLNLACDVETPFSTLSDIESLNSYRCIRKTFEEAISVLIEKYGGHLVRDNFNIQIRNKIGEDRNVVLAYGKNIKSLKATENWDNVATKILPVGKEGLTLEEVYLEVEEDLYDIPFTKVITFSQDHISSDNYKDEEGNIKEDYSIALVNDLREQALKYLQENKIPKVTYSLSAYLKDVSDVGDIIYVKHPKCKIDITTNVIAIEYDVILESYTKIVFGNFKSNLKNLIKDVSTNAIEESKKNTEDSMSKLEKELIAATNRIKDTMGSSYVVYDGDKILILDALPKEEAKNVIRINSGGIGFSDQGINGNFKSAWDISGTMNMENINTINLVADMIKGGTLKLGSNLNESGILELYNEANKKICVLDKDGLALYCENNEFVLLNPVDGFVGYNSKGEKTYWADGDEFHQKRSVVEEEITIANKLKFVSIKTDTNNGVGLVSMI